jgi:hypothetical protein
MRATGDEAGQAVVEVALILTIVLMLTLGLVDIGRAFYAYNAVSMASRDASRWASVVGGTCSGPFRGGSISDWCNQFSQTSSDFWNAAGNKPLQGGPGSACPWDASGKCACPTTILTPAPSPTPYYTVSNYASSTSTTIVGAIAQKFDTNATQSNWVAGALTPGFELSKMYVCIQLPPEAYANSVNGSVTVGPGYVVAVYVYYPFKPAAGLFGGVQLNLIGSSQFETEGT